MTKHLKIVALPRPQCHRAGGWDGVYPLWGEVGVKDFMPAEEYPKLIDFIKSERQSDAPFDVAYWGMSPGDPANATEIVKPYADAGVTWWMEAISPWRFGGIADDGSWDTEARRKRIVQGPPKL